MNGWFEEEDDSPRPDAGENTDDEDAPRSDETAGAEAGARGESRGERYRVKGEELLSRVKEIVREGNVRRITIRNDEDRVLLSFPLSAGVIGAALLPMWAAIGAVAALVGNCSIDVERRE
ncbi:MAG: DUF4342 domain-containing protein [Longimicrobiales bacterium]|nr:DUF4342 domain-containing protein [Longimicrobiales bacterium]